MADGGMFLFFSKIATNNVIHQKNKLSKKKPQKLYPLLLAIRAGIRAKNIHSNTASAITKNPKKDTEFMTLLYYRYCCLLYLIGQKAILVTNRAS